MMELLIMPLRIATLHVPHVKTYAIRIFSEFGLDHLTSMQKSDNWVSIERYVFDDVWPGMPGGLYPRDVVFSEDIASRIIDDFMKRKDISEALLVHCSRGKNRSPAVAMALNEIFCLGHDTEELKKQYPDANWYVYETMLRKG